MFKHTLDEHTELRLLEVRHAEALFQLTDSSRESLREWLPWVDFTKTAEDSKGFIEGTMKKFGNNDGFEAGIWYKGELAGVVGLHAINWSNRSTTIGYWLGERFTGHGLMTKACQAVIDYCFEELDLKRIEIRAATGNGKSFAIPERLGFQKEGVVRCAERLNGAYVDHYVYGLINE
ncbi:N-acetyltransferase [Halobacillus fulvus]|nr:N-acetyltransferase [Halobacillus fulvus]